MAKSYNKNFIVKQERVNKNYLKKVVRQKLKIKDLLNADYESETLIKGMQYKRIVKNYDTWRYRWTKEDAIQDYKNKDYIRKNYSTLEEWLQYWERACLRK